MVSPLVEGELSKKNIEKTLNIERKDQRNSPAFGVIPIYLLSSS